MPTALITGITGQDGSYLAEHLLGLGYSVHGTSRSATDAARHPNLVLVNNHPRLSLHDLPTHDESTLRTLVSDLAPDEIYHLAAQTHVPESWRDPASTTRTNVLGTIALLDAIRECRPAARLFHAASSLVFGQPDSAPQSEETPFKPDNPYGASKAMASQMLAMYRHAHRLFLVNGICYNHESPRRGPDFVTGKICRAAARISAGDTKPLVLGALDARRDWGDARHFVRGFHAALQAADPTDYVFATGRLHSVQDVVQAAFDAVGLDWQPHVRQDPAFFRPTEPTALVGNPTRARERLGWSDPTSLTDLIREMTRAHLA